MELRKISELPIKEITTVDAYLPIIDTIGEDDIENYRISLLNLFKTGGIINVNRTYGDTNYTLQTALAVIEPTLLVNGVFITFKGMDGWKLYQKELDTYVKYLNRIDDELEVGSNNPLSNDAITRMYHELLSSINNVASIPHYAITDKNAEPNFQHVTQEEKTGFHTHNNKEYLDNYNPTLFATALQGEKADSALQSLPPNTVIDADYPALKNKVNGIEENANNYEHPFQHSTQILSGVSSIVGSIDRYLNQRGDFTKPTISHIDLTYKNDETAFQHIDTTTTKETLVETDKVAILDSVTGKVVLTDKSNVGGGGSTDIISTNATNNTGTIVIDTTPNWQRVNISSGGNTLFLDYASGVLPNKNREYLLIINNATASTITLTLPTASFEKGGITYYFINSEVSVSIEAGKSIEVNVIFIFTSITTCNVRTLISQF